MACATVIARVNAKAAQPIPELAELLCVLHNHTDVIAAALRQPSSNRPN
jgi:transposase